MEYKILSILIATVKEREDSFNYVRNEFLNQGNENKVEILSCSDNKEMSIGLKRQKLLENAKGKWIVFFDDDDFPSPAYNELILNCIQLNPGIDCIGINGTMTTNGENPQTWVHHLGYPWKSNCKSSHGFDYIRPIIHFNPVLKEKALQAGFKDIRFGEDKDYSDRLNMLLQKQGIIHAPLFHYNYTTKLPHNQKYGIK